MFNAKILSIFFCEFHAVEGPKMILQVPEEVITKDNFTVLHKYIIPKEHLHRKIMRLNSNRHTILGYPISILGEKYERNVYYFNCCLVLDSSADAENYEMIVKKLNVFLENRALQGLLLNGSDKEDLSHLLNTVFNDLNRKGQAQYVDDALHLHLQIDTLKNDKFVVGSYDVPIFCDQLQNDLWSVIDHHSTPVGKKIVAMINGERDVRRIASEADVDVAMVKDCLNELILYNNLHLIPIFQYSNVYVTTPKICKLFQDTKMQEQCIKFISLTGRTASLCDIFTCYSSFVHNLKLGNLCQRLNPRSKGIDEKKLVQFGLTKGLIRCLKKYPIKDYKEISSDYNIMVTSTSGKKRSVDNLLNGICSFDCISGKIGLSSSKLSQQLEEDPNIFICTK